MNDLEQTYRYKVDEHESLQTNLTDIGTSWNLFWQVWEVNILLESVLTSMIINNFENS